VQEAPVPNDATSMKIGTTPVDNAPSRDSAQPRVGTASRRWRDEGSDGNMLAKLSRENAALREALDDTTRRLSKLEGEKQRLYEEGCSTMGSDTSQEWTPAPSMLTASCSSPRYVRGITMPVRISPAAKMSVAPHPLGTFPLNPAAVGSRLRVMPSVGPSNTVAPVGVLASPQLSPSVNPPGEPNVPLSTSSNNASVIAAAASAAVAAAAAAATSVTLPAESASPAASSGEVFCPPSGESGSSGEGSAPSVDAALPWPSELSEIAVRIVAQAAPGNLAQQRAAGEQAA